MSCTRKAINLIHIIQAARMRVFLYGNNENVTHMGSSLKYDDSTHR